MECLHQYRGSVISLRGFHATPHVVGAPCHYPLYRQKGQLKVDLTIQRAYTAQLAATDLDPYSVSLVAGYSTRAGIPSCCGWDAIEITTSVKHDPIFSTGRRVQRTEERCFLGDETSPGSEENS